MGGRLDRRSLQRLTTRRESAGHEQEMAFVDALRRHDIAHVIVAVFVDSL